MAVGRSSQRLRFLIAAFCAALLPLAFASGTTAIAAPQPTTWHVHVGEQSATGAIQGMQYLPGEIWINVHDTVHWTADSMEPHTVSFLPVDATPGEFNPFNTTMTGQTTGESTIGAPGEVRNSGVLSTIQIGALPPAVTIYDSAPPDTPYRHTQQFYDAQFHQGQAAVIADGSRLRGTVMAQSDSHHVFVGALDDMAMVMRFLRPQVAIRVGETIDFDASMNQGPVPHTVTFGNEPPGPFPVGDPTNYTGGDLSSGFPFPGLDPHHFRVTFNKAGVYHYICQFHDGMGMVGTVVVTPGD
jgi:plastocyanin